MKGMTDYYGKCSKVWRPRTIFLGIFFLMFTLFLCSLLISDQYTSINGFWDGSTLVFISNNCGKRCPRGSEALPQGIVEEFTDLELKPLWSSSRQQEHEKSLLAMAVGIHQKDGVDQIIRKFPAKNFTLMLFHYDGEVDTWKNFPWFTAAIHIVGFNQTKWWFAKRFMHPDVVNSYEYIFVWDEDLGVEYFQADRYLAVVRKEKLEISQPALDYSLSTEVHHHITIRRPKSKVHRRIYRNRGKETCFENSTRPPCTGWVEMMAPVFSRAAWRCAWYLIQNDLVHGWGMDMKLGYCAQGDPTKHVGVVDSEYIIHRGIPSLGGGYNKTKSLAKDRVAVPSSSGVYPRERIRKRAGVEMQMFKERWKAAASADTCWSDIYDRIPKG